MPTPHKWAKEIRAFADGFEIESASMLHADPAWTDDTNPSWGNEKYQFRIKPAAPKWPQTTMTRDSLCEIYRQCEKEFGNSLVEVVNAAIAHECSTGALVPADKVREIEAKARTEGVKEGKADTEERDIAIAINVRAACLLNHPGILSNDDLNKIIAAVS